MKSKKGFTLVELIVVIVIIGVLAAVMIPQITKYIEKARRSNDVSNASNMTLQLSVFATEHEIDMDEMSGIDVRTICTNLGYDLVPSTSKWTYIYKPETKQVLVVDWANTIYADTSLTDFLEISSGEYLLGKGTTKIEEAVNALCQGQYNVFKTLDSTKYASYIENINTNYAEGDTLFINAGGVIGATNVPTEKKKIILCEGINFIPSSVTVESLGPTVAEDIKLVNTFVAFACAGSEEFCESISLNPSEIIQFDDLTSNVSISYKDGNSFTKLNSTNNVDLYTKLSYKLSDVAKEENPVELSSLLKESDLKNIKFKLGEDIKVASTTTITFSEIELSKNQYVYRMSILYMGDVRPVGYFELVYTK